MSKPAIVTCTEIPHLYSIRRDRGSSGNGRRHRHSFWELILFERGTGIHNINDTVYKFRPHEIALLAPSDLHQLESTDGTTFDCIKVGFTYNVYNQHLSNICCFEHFPVLVSLDDRDYAKAVSLLDMLYDEYNAPQKCGSEIFSVNLLEQLIVLIARNLPGQPNESPTDAGRLQKMLLYIQEHFSEPITINDVAKALNYSPKYFGKLFIKELGVPFREYLKALRLNYAYHLIKYSDLSIVDICYNTGFHSPTYFSKSFKQKYGQSPNNLRKQADS